MSCRLSTWRSSSTATRRVITGDRSKTEHCVNVDHQGECDVRDRLDELLRHELVRLPGERAAPDPSETEGELVTETRRHLRRVPPFPRHLPRGHDLHLRQHPAGWAGAQHPQEHRQYDSEKAQA